MDAAAESADLGPFPDGPVPDGDEGQDQGGVVSALDVRGGGCDCAMGPNGAGAGSWLSLLIAFALGRRRRT
jgi:MYXO-CTERM domain-containing protein